MVWPAGRALVTLRVTTSPAFTSSTGPGSCASAAQVGAKPQMGIVVLSDMVAVPALAQRSKAGSAAARALDGVTDAGRSVRLTFERRAGASVCLGRGVATG